VKILCDTREQKPLEFHHPLITEVVVTKLPVGDYSCQFEDGHNTSVFFERKSLPDLFGSLTKGYARFKREILRAQEASQTLIIIVEGSYSKILKGTEYSMVEGLSIIRKMFTLWLRHGVQFVCCNNREEMAEYICEFYYAMGKEYVRRKDDSRQNPEVS